MDTVRLGDRVRVVCATRLDDGTDLETPAVRDRPYWVRADGRRASVVRGAVVGMTIGERKTITLEVRPGRKLTLSIAVLGIKGAGVEADTRLETERRLVDAAMDAERRLMDSLVPNATPPSRGTIRAKLASARRLTDADVAAGRQRTDAEVQRSADAYADERDAHARTRAALTTRDELLAIVSHDLRNPIGSITMAIEVLSQQPAQAWDTNELARYLELIRRNAGESLRLIEDLIDMESLALGQFRLDVAAHDVLAVMREALEMFENLPTARAFIFRLEEPRAPMSGHFDRGRVTQVLSNLIGNALKFSPNGGVVTLSARLVEDQIEVSVKDCGPGIPAAAQEAIFERFSQLQQRDRRGLGLGLHISRLLVEAHGGRIWVESQSGRGSTFRFMLPNAVH